MLLQPRINTWEYTASNVLTTRPVAIETNYGTAITPGASNTFGSYTEILPATSHDTYLVKLCINFGNSSTAARDLLVTIGIDPAGGTSYSDFIVNLMGSCASSFQSGAAAGAGIGGHWYEFPVRIPAGSTIAAKASVNNATAGSVAVAIWCYGQPSAPETIKYGSYVETIGANTAASNGTAVTQGTTSMGSWTSLGNTTKDLWFFQFGVGSNNASFVVTSHIAELSCGANNDMIITNGYFSMGSQESMGKLPHSQGFRRVPAGTTIYGRSQSSNTAATSFSMAAYGVGG
jgi:hypothetical protein